MSNPLESIAPRDVWFRFYQISQIPRPSKKETKIVSFVETLAKDYGLPVLKDTIGNLLIKKPGQGGCESHDPLALQSHLDMVCEKNSDKVFDFNTQSIELLHDGDWVRANGTTLGADNGLGAAMMLAIMTDQKTPHCPLQLLFTVDEEAGMGGVIALNPNWVTAKQMINLDTEEDDKIYIGCAGGMYTFLDKSYQWDVSHENSLKVTATLEGGLGGHSGTDIIQKLANAIKWLGLFLNDVCSKCDVYLTDIQGGNLMNAIPREASVTFLIKEKDKDTLLAIHDHFEGALKNEFKRHDSNLSLSLDISETKSTLKTLSKTNSMEVISILNALPHGVLAMSPEVAALVETSVNLATFKHVENKINIGLFMRSSTELGIPLVNSQLQSIAQLGNYHVTTSDGYPGWQPNSQSNLLTHAKNVYRKMFSKDPAVAAIHAGLECGLLKEKYPQLDMISIGPTIKGAHSPDERASISSLQKTWSYFLELIKTTG